MVFQHFALPGEKRGALGVTEKPSSETESKVPHLLLAQIQSLYCLREYSLLPGGIQL